MWFAALAGIAEAKPYGMKPDAQSGKYLQKLKNKLGYLSDKSALYQLSTPGRRKDTLSRTINTMHVPPPLIVYLYTHGSLLYICTYTSTIYTYIYKQKDIFTYIYVYTDMYVYILWYTCIYIYMHMAVRD